MKEDEAKSGGPRELVMYVEKGDHTFGPVQTGSYFTENFLDDLLDKRQRHGEACLARLRAGEVSPVGYYRELLDMTEVDLACRVGISRWRLRKHSAPDGFAGIKVRLLARYAEVFGVPIARLFEVVVPELDAIARREESTADHRVVITHISVKDP
jgi:hypothetical protein